MNPMSKERIEVEPLTLEEIIKLHFDGWYFYNVHPEYNEPDLMTLTLARNLGDK